MKNILKAKELGYFIELHYISVKSVQIAKDRVKYRVENGGHGIPERDIENRFVESFHQLNIVLQECDLIAFMIIRKVSDDLQSVKRVNWFDYLIKYQIGFQK